MESTAPAASPEWATVMDLIKTLPDHKSQQVLQLQAQAVAYVWGWQDGKGESADSNVSWNFSIAYGWHAYKYAADIQGFRSNIASAFKEWTETGTIRG